MTNDDTRADSTVGALTELARTLQKQTALEAVLQAIAEMSAKILGVERASVRLLDPSRRRLLAIARAGSPLHENPDTEFLLGVGLMGWVAEHCEPLRTGHAERDPRFESRPGMKTAMRSFISVPLVTNDKCLGVLSGVSDQEDIFTHEDEELLVLLATISAPYVEVARLSRLTNVDPLTGALNRRGLDEMFHERTVAAPLSVALFDIDHFKGINDAHGHAFGDAVLQRITGVFADVVRLGDAVVRYGGEEFLLVLPRVGLQAAWRIAERARRKIEETELVMDGSTVKLTVSGGVAEMRPGESRDDVIARADGAMYAAKNAGRNRVETTA